MAQSNFQFLQNFVIGLNIFYMPFRTLYLCSCSNSYEKQYILSHNTSIRDFYSILLAYEVAGKVSFQQQIPSHTSWLLNRKLNLWKIAFMQHLHKNRHSIISHFAPMKIHTKEANFQILQDWYKQWNIPALLYEISLSQSDSESMRN